MGTCDVRRPHDPEARMLRTLEDVLQRRLPRFTVAPSNDYPHPRRLSEPSQF